MSSPSKRWPVYVDDAGARFSDCTMPSRRGLACICNSDAAFVRCAFKDDTDVK
jgi:hypothetical protein